MLTALLPVHAQDIEAIRAQLSQGKWQESAAAAAALNSSAGYALTAEALTDGASVVPANASAALLQKAQDYARRAIQTDPNNAEGYLRLAVAQGREAQYAGVVKSLGIARNMKWNLEKAIQLAPNSAKAYVVLGLWHATISSKGILAAAAAGANKAAVQSNFAKALALEPNNPIAKSEYAHALLLQGNRTAAVQQLKLAVSIPSDDYWERRDQAAAKSLLDSLQP